MSIFGCAGSLCYVQAYSGFGVASFSLQWLLLWQSMASRALSSWGKKHCLSSCDAWA